MSAGTPHSKQQQKGHSSSNQNQRNDKGGRSSEHAGQKSERMEKEISEEEEENLQGFQNYTHKIQFQLKNASQEEQLKLQLDYDFIQCTDKQFLVLMRKNELGRYEVIKDLNQILQLNEGRNQTHNLELSRRNKDHHKDRDFFKIKRAKEKIDEPSSEEKQLSSDYSNDQNVGFIQNLKRDLAKSPVTVTLRHLRALQAEAQTKEPKPESEPKREVEKSIPKPVYKPQRMVQSVAAKPSKRSTSKSVTARPVPVPAPKTVPAPVSPKAGTSLGAPGIPRVPVAPRAPLPVNNRTPVPVAVETSAEGVAMGGRSQRGGKRPLPVNYPSVPFGYKQYSSPYYPDHKPQGTGIPNTAMGTGTAMGTNMGASMGSSMGTVPGTGAGMGKGAYVNYYPYGYMGRPDQRGKVSNPYDPLFQQHFLMQGMGADHRMGVYGPNGYMVPGMKPMGIGMGQGQKMPMGMGQGQKMPMSPYHMDPRHYNPYQYPKSLPKQSK